jgi:uncharacterized protein (TIGR02145 family)
MGFVFGEVLLASYGTPEGDCCDGLAIGSCHSDNAVEVIEALILENGTSISISPHNNNFCDPCIGVIKRLCVQIEVVDEGLSGCTDSLACNYDASAIYEDGSCLSCDLFAERCLDGTIWDEDLGGCVPSNSADLNLDGCVGMSDLLNLLSAFGTCANEGENTEEWACGDPLEYQGYEYETVQIGEQCWFAENLRSQSYQNGDVIPANLPDSVWASTTEGAVAVYGEGESSVLSGSGDEEQNLVQFGRMYNSFACVDERNLCPLGWHVPFSSDFNDLTAWANENSIDSLGVKIRHTQTWLSSAIATDELGFGWKAGGNKVSGGAFNGQSLYGEMMVSDCPCWAELGYADLGFWLEALYTGPRMAASVRCLKDTE